jgi:membrane protease YdiL (CAAX protease family)
MKSLKKHITRTNVILFIVPILLFVYIRFGMAPNFDFFFGRFVSDPVVESYLRTFYQYLSMFLLLCIIPLLIVRLGFREKLSNYGVRTGDAKFGYKVVVISLLPIAAGLILGALSQSTKPPVFHSVYPVVPAAAGSAGSFLIYFFFLLFYYAAFEFFYRGFMLFGLKDKFGPVAAVLIQTIPSVLVHFDKPDAEFFMAIPAELFLGWLAVRTKSLWYGFLIHLYIGVGIEIACIVFR